MIHRKRRTAKQITLNDQRAFIREIAPYYSRDRWQRIESIGIHLEPVLKRADGNPVLEIGAGAGVVLSLLQQAGRTAYGVEVVSSMIGAARENGVEGMIQADGAALPFANDSFALATLWGNTLGPIPGRENRIALLREAYRVLATNAPLAVAVLNRYAGPRRLLQPLEFVFHYPNNDGKGSERHGYNRYYTPRQLKKELRLAGFQKFERISGIFDSVLIYLARA